MIRTDALIRTIESLDEARTVEAAGLLASAVGAGPVAGLEPPDLVARPLENRADIVDLCQLALLVAATDPDDRELADEAVAGAGRKQLVLGGMEPGIGAAAAISALHICITKGRTSSEELITVTEQPDGTRKSVTVRKVLTASRRSWPPWCGRCFSSAARPADDPGRPVGAEAVGRSGDSQALPLPVARGAPRRRVPD